ncbi:MAG: cupin domain-containing protein [Deltaproteobacteria bacterium]|nr:cupin domain-containing protein [Deltaproteobacteria bacterium]
MAQGSQAAKATEGSADLSLTKRGSTYERWIESTGVPTHKGYYVEDLRTLELGWWEERQCNASFLLLAGQEGVTEARVTEIPPGKTLPPIRFALDEIVYVADGRGLTTVWGEEGGPKKTFEWQKHSLFMIPRNHFHQLSNAQGYQGARLMHYNYLPIAMSIVPDPDFFFNNPYIKSDVLQGQNGGFYSEAKQIRLPGNQSAARAVVWSGNFFPDMRAWDKLENYQERGAGGHRVQVRFPGSEMWSHMSVFPSKTYKKAHRHGPGVVIIIPSGEGYSIMWPEGGEKVVIPWHEASVFVPPNRWFHQHFNVGPTPARYLASHAPRGTSGRSERVEDRQRDQIEYPAEDPMIREKFEEELGKRGLKSLMPGECYKDPNYKFSYQEAD